MNHHKNIHRSHSHTSNNNASSSISSSISSSSKKTNRQDEEDAEEAAEIYNAATDAIEAGNIDHLRVLLSLRFPQESSARNFVRRYTNEDGDTLLHWACLEGQLSAVRLLLREFHAAVDAPNHDGQTPLHIAAAAGAGGIVKYLWSFQANPHTCDCHGQTPLFVACAGGHLHVVKYLVLVCRSDVEHTDREGATALLHMLSTLQPETAHVSRYLELLQYLVETAGANIYHCDSNGRNGLLWVADLGAPAVPLARYLLEQQKVQQAERDEIQQLQQRGGSSSSKNSHNMDASVTSSHTKKSAIDLKDLSHADKTGFTPLLRAIDFGNPAMIQCLLQYGGEDVLPEHALTPQPFLYAVEKQDWTAVYLMLQHRPAVWRKILFLGMKSQLFLEKCTSIQDTTVELQKALLPDNETRSSSSNRHDHLHSETFQNCPELQDAHADLTRKIPSYMRQVYKMQQALDTSLALRQAAQIRQVTQQFEADLFAMKEAHQYLLLQSDDLPFSEPQLHETRQQLQTLLQRLETCRQSLLDSSDDHHQQQSAMAASSPI